MTQLKKNFALFFTTRGRSLEVWDHIGMFEREVALYRLTAASFATMYFFTYGGKKDLSYASRLPSNVVIVPKPAYIPVMLYSFLLPFIHVRILRRVSILKTNQMDGSWAAVIAKKFYGGKLIIRCGYEWLQFIERSGRGWVKRTFAYLVEKFAYANADKIVVTSKGSHDFITDRFGVLPSLVATIPNYVDTDLFAPVEHTKETGSLITVGRLEPQKNLPMLLNAIKGLNVTLTIIGSGSQKGMLADMAAKNGVSIVLKGNLSQKEIVGEFNSGELFVLPSLFEGHPKTLLEAMACGMACIGSDIPGIADTITDGVDGLLCGTDEQSIRKSIEKLLPDESMRVSLGIQARHTILEKYSLGAVVKQELALYHSLLS